MSGQTQRSPVKTFNLPDKCPITGTNLQAFESDVVDHGSAACATVLDLLNLLTVGTRGLQRPKRFAPL